MSMILGIDSGGTKTLAALADNSGKVVALLRCPSLDPSGNAPWQELLADLLSRLPDMTNIAAAALGLPFHGR